MFRYIPEPSDPGGFEADVGVEAARHGLLDDGLLLLVQELNQPPLARNKALDAPVSMVEKAYDSGLLGGWWYKDGYSFHTADREVPLPYPNSVRSACRRS